MIIEIKSNEIWDEIKDDVQDAIQDSMSDLEFQDYDDVARVVNEEVQYILDGDCRYIVEDIADSQFDHRISDSLAVFDEPIKKRFHELEREISKLQSQLKLANFKLRRSK